MASLSLLVTRCPDSSLALTNKVYLHNEDFASLTSRRPDRPYAQINGDIVFTIEAHPAIEKGHVGLAGHHRTQLSVSFQQPVEVSAYAIDEYSNVYISHADLAVAFNKRSTPAAEFEVTAIEDAIHRVLDTQLLTQDQVFILDVQGYTLKFKVIKVEVVDINYFKQTPGDPCMPAVETGLRGVMTKKTLFSVSKAHDSAIKLKGSNKASKNTKTIFRPGWDFEQMGIGGLDAEFSDIFRRAFASRVFPPAVIKELGVQHVRGILLYGPPGTGKTLMARQIGKMLNGKEPKIVNGPEILNKFVGQSEENIRKLFADAEKEEKERGDDSDLHIIIFDEIDAICKTRGSTNNGTGVNDSIVNQLLAKIDGVDRLNNVLLIGMTNRKDMIDEALLRPGRLEVHMEISLPDEKGRLQIFRIHTNDMRSHNRLADDVDVEELAGITKNYTGAEIEGVVKSASSFAMNRNLDVKNLSKEINTDSIIVTRDDFFAALDEVTPIFGVTNEELNNCIENGMINYGPSFQRLNDAGELFIKQIQESERSRLVSVLLEGAPGTGKTALAASLALNGGFPFVKLISAEAMVGFSETGKCNKIHKVFEDAYKSPLSVIVVDDIERLLEYVPIGPRFSNAVLQTLTVLIKRVPPQGKRLLVIGTTSRRRVLEDMGMMDVFTASLNVPPVQPTEAKAVLSSLSLFSSSDLDDVCSGISTPIPIKRMMMIAEMARQGEVGSVADRFSQCINDYLMTGI